MRHTLEQVRTEYRRLDLLCEVDSSQMELCISKRMTKYFGYCSYGQMEPTKITLAEFTMDLSDEVFYDIIRHEYAHALVKLREPESNHGHDRVWKLACLEVGCNPARCETDRDALKTAKEARAKKAKYTVQCEGCEHSWNFLRKTNLIQSLEAGRKRTATCPHCGGRDFILRIV